MEIGIIMAGEFVDIIEYSEKSKMATKMATN